MCGEQPATAQVILPVLRHIRSGATATCQSTHWQGGRRAHALLGRGIGCLQHARSCAADTLGPSNAIPTRFLRPIRTTIRSTVSPLHFSSDVTMTAFRSGRCQHDASNARLSVADAVTARHTYICGHRRALDNASRTTAQGQLLHEGCTAALTPLLTDLLISCC